METASDLTLLPQHLADLRRSGLTDEQVRLCGFRSETDPGQVARLLGWSRPAADLGPCLVIPFPNADGRPTGYARLKPDRPRKDRSTTGKAVRYESPRRAANRAYLTPGTLCSLANPSVPLIVTEGEKKAAKADQEGFPCVGLVGVYGWQAKRKRGADGKGAGPRNLIPDLAAIPWQGRTVFIAYDSDLADKAAVRWAEWHLAETLSRAGAEVYVIRLPPGPDGVKQGLDDFVVSAGADALRRLLAAAKPCERPADVPDDRPVLAIGTDEHRVNEQATAALAAEPDVYQRGGLLVHVLEQDVDTDPTAAIRRPGGAPSVRELVRPLLRERLTRCAHWVKIKTDGDGGAVQVPAHPPDWCVGAVHARGRWPGVRRLNGLVTHPALLPDGSLLAADGYHPGTGLLAYMPPGLTTSVPDRPTREEVATAVAALCDPLADFPFASPAHRASLVAGLLTPLAWHLFDGPSPLFLIDKNVRGAGAGLLADVVALVVTGRRFPVMSYTNDREELRKKITTLAVEGERLVLLDNLAGAVGNDVLDAALTADTWKDRVLGSNKVYDGPLHVVWFGTGNNVQLHADTSRRVCHVRMETADERPETRTGFRHPDLRAHVRRTRGRLLSAALTILRGWVVAGRPRHGLTPWGSYEGWSGTVREAVVFAGLPDPGDTRVLLQSAADRDAVAMVDIIRGLDEMDPARRGLTTAEIVTRLLGPEPVSAWAADMRAAVEELCGKLDHRTLAYRFRHFARRTFGGRMVDTTGKGGTKTNRWAVFEVGPRRADPSPSSPSSPGPRDASEGDEGDEGDDLARGEHVVGVRRRPNGRLFDDYRDSLPPD